MPDIKSLAYSRNVDMVNTFTKSLTKLTMMLSACEPIKAAPSETLHQKKITGKLTAEEYGIIPAYAGSTRHGQRYSSQGWDHPRVCGEHFLEILVNADNTGSSPRMRGAHDPSGMLIRRVGIIPAYAGSTKKLQRNLLMIWDHPRVCGEHAVRWPLPGIAAGSSPRMRGAHVELFVRSLVLGIIPAYAGSTCWSPSWCRRGWDHPRVCGEHNTAVTAMCGVSGSSPRMRGAPRDALGDRVAHGIIPAYAGSTTVWRGGYSMRRDHPRVCGEH